MQIYLSPLARKVFNPIVNSDRLDLITVEGFETDIRVFTV